MPVAEWTHPSEGDLLKAEIKDVDGWITSIIAFAGLPGEDEGSSDEEEDEEEEKVTGDQGGGESGGNGEEEDEDDNGHGHDEGEDGKGSEDDDDTEKDDEVGGEEDEKDEGNEDEDDDDDDDEEQPDEGSEEDRVWRTVLRNRRDGIQQDNNRFGRPMNKNERHLVRRIFRRQPIDPNALTRSQAEFVRNGSLLRMCEHPGAMTFPEQVAYLARELPQHVGNASRHTTLFKTAGGLLGAGHESVRPGDLVTILDEEKHPIILRPRETTAAEGFTMQGYAYVDGIMYGEFFCTPPQPGRKFKPLVGTGINNVGSYWGTRDMRGYYSNTQDGERAEPGKRVQGPECEAFEIY